VQGSSKRIAVCDQQFAGESLLKIRTEVAAVVFDSNQIVASRLKRCSSSRASVERALSMTTGSGRHFSNARSAAGEVCVGC